MKLHTRWLLSTLLCATALLTIALRCPAETLKVDGGSPTAVYKTITAAMQAVRPGDTVIVKAGVYREQFRIPSGYGCMNLTWEDYDVRENVMMTGHGSPLFGTKGIKGYRADRNVFWNSARVENPTIIATDDGWHRDFEAVRSSTGQDEHSVYADPRFRNAPVAFGVLDSGRLHECTKDRWYLRNGAGAFAVGDHVEVNFDGVKRRITRIEGATITVDLGLPEKPVKGWLVANWAEKDGFRED